MLKAYEFRIYPTKEQEQLFLKANGMCRLYWNTALARKQEAWENDEKWNIGSAKAVFTECKPEALEWIKEIDSTILAAEWNDICSAFNNFFKSCRGQRKLRVNAPRFKSKKHSQVAISFTSQNTPKILKNSYLFLTRRIGPIKGKFHRWAYGEFKHATIKQTSTGKWFVKICVEKKEESKNENGKSIGIDWNCRDDDTSTLVTRLQQQEKEGKIKDSSMFMEKCKQVIYDRTCRKKQWNKTDNLVLFMFCRNRGIRTDGVDFIYVLAYHLYIS